MTKKVLIIAEAGVNHNGSLDMALKLVDEAAAVGADYIKFQTFTAEELVTRSAPKARYQVNNTGQGGSQYAMLKELEIDLEGHKVLKAYCDNKKIGFLSSPFDLPSADLLVNKLGLCFCKIPSGELSNLPLLLSLARMNCEVILSSGMATLGDIEIALGVLAFGYLGATDQPSIANFKKIYSSDAAQAVLRQKVWLLQCTTQYPTPYKDINLKVMDTLRKAFDLPVGLSDHSLGISIPMAAAARGARIIEKHFTLDKNLSGPDHQASLDPAELRQMVEGIRQIELALGNTTIKTIAGSEAENVPIAKKYLVANRSISAGEILTSGNIAIKRAAREGLSPIYYWDVLGKHSNKSYQEGDLIEL